MLVTAPSQLRLTVRRQQVGRGGWRSHAAALLQPHTCIQEWRQPPAMGGCGDKEGIMHLAKGQILPLSYGMREESNSHLALAPSGFTREQAPHPLMLAGLPRARAQGLQNQVRPPGPLSKEGRLSRSLLRPGLHMPIKGRQRPSASCRPVGMLASEKRQLF